MQQLNTVADAEARSVCNSQHFTEECYKLYNSCMLWTNEGVRCYTTKPIIIHYANRCVSGPRLYEWHTLYYCVYSESLGECNPDSVRCPTAENCLSLLSLGT